jgi:protein-tyrosine phosphatase
MKTQKKLLVLTLLFHGISLTQNANLSEERIWAKRLDKNTYEINLEKGEQNEVVYGPSIDEINWVNKTPIKSNKSITVPVNEGERLFFAAVFNQDTVYFSERRLILEGGINFRDVGGLKTKTGRYVQWGRVFRCGDMGRLSENDLALITFLGITDVVDFRNEQEIERSPDRYPENGTVTRHHVQIGMREEKNEKENMSVIYQLLQDPETTRELADSIFNLFYLDMPNNLSDFKPYFDVLINNDNNTLFHCTAGKDRTGMGAALFLYALGVSKETIIEEYYLSNRYTKGIMKGNPGMENLNPDAVAVFEGVQPHYIRNALQVIEKKYGSIDAALEKEFGLDEAARKALVEKYTF